MTENFASLLLEREQDIVRYIERELRTMEGDPSYSLDIRKKANHMLKVIHDMRIRE